MRTLQVMPPLPLGVYFHRRSSSALPFPLGEANCALFARARHGLWAGLEALPLEPGDQVLAPAYHHGSEIEALSRAGLNCRFYDPSEALEPDESELEGLLGPHVRALHLIHYFGFPQNASRWRDWCDKRGLLLIEDAAQAWLASHDGSPTGSFGDLSIFCLYKTFGLPDGGALVSSSPPIASRRARRLGLRQLAGRHRAWLAQRSALFARQGSPSDREGYVPGEFELGEPQGPALSTVHLLRRVADPEAAAKRRANYAYLLNRIADMVPSPFDRLADGACPFLFPVAVKDTTGLLDHLSGHGVETERLWPVPHPSLPVANFPRAAWWRATIVGLPVHQELLPSHLDRIAEAVHSL